jgi:large subunit ribosomal protein L3
MAFRIGLLGKKIGMTQRFDAKGVWQALCVIQTGPCVVLQVKTVESDGYSAIQLGFDDKVERRTRKAQLGLASKANCAPKRFVREIRLTPEEVSQFQVGQTLSVSQVFKAGDIIDAIGTSRGKGFQGVMKKYHFSGFRGSHGTHEYFRHGGSVGCRLTPGHVHRGKRMPSQMGNKRVTVQNLEVVEVLADQNLLLLKGNTPGAPASYVMLRHGAKRAYLPYKLPTEKPAEPAATEAAPA